ELFENHLKEIPLRWFDPTQSYDENIIDKGILEGLMLKRAKCTIYMAQESDTLGKDSELASTLAQGKPVIAYIPFFSSTAQDQYVERLLKVILAGAPALSERQVILRQLQVFRPQAAWEDEQVIRWIANPR